MLGSQQLACSFCSLLPTPTHLCTPRPAGAWHTGLQTPRPHAHILVSPPTDNASGSPWGEGVPTAQPGNPKVSDDCSRVWTGTVTSGRHITLCQWPPAHLRRVQSLVPQSAVPRQVPVFPPVEGSSASANLVPSGQDPDVWRGSQVTKGEVCWRSPESDTNQKRRWVVGTRILSAGSRPARRKHKSSPT